MIYLILGRTASGKDMLGDFLEKEGINQIISKTTRKKRNDDDKHVFVDEKTYENDKENILVETVIDDNRYYITKDMLTDDSFYIIDPDTAKILIEKTPDVAYHIFYVSSDNKEIRKERYLNRDEKANEDEFIKRDNSEDKMFKDFEEDIVNDVIYDAFKTNLLKINVLNNSTNDKRHLEVFAREIKRLNTQFKRVKSLVNVLIDENMVVNDNRKIKITINDNENTPYDIYKTVDEIAFLAMYDKGTLSDLIIPLIAMKDNNRLKKVLKDLSDSI